MYLQVLLHQDDKFNAFSDIRTIKFEHFNLIHSHSVPRHFSQFASFNKLVDDECHRAFPRVAEILKEHLYVDTCYPEQITLSKPEQSEMN